MYPLPNEDLKLKPSLNYKLYEYYFRIPSVVNSGELKQITPVNLKIPRALDILFRQYFKE